MAHQARNNQFGGSILGNLLLIVLFVYGMYLAIQYVPQFIESRSLDSVLDSIANQHQAHPYASAQQVEQAIKSNLNMNQMDDMMKHIRIRESGNSISVEVNYQRELDLVFEKKTLNINKSVDLD